MNKEPNIFNKEIGLRIRRQREACSLTRETLSEKADISTQFLADIETGRKSMTAKTIINIAQSLSISTDYILTGQTSPDINDIQDTQLLFLLENMTTMEKENAIRILKLYVSALQNARKSNDVK